MKSYRAVCTSRVGMCLGGGRVDNTARPALHPTLPLPQLINYSSTVQSPCPPLSTAQQPVFSSPSLSRSDFIVTGAVRPYKLEQGGVTLATQQWAQRANGGPPQACIRQTMRAWSSGLQQAGQIFCRFSDNKRQTRVNSLFLSAILPLSAPLNLLWKPFSF